METKNKIAIAKDFVAYHRNNDIKRWPTFTKFNDDERYIDVYNNLVNGEYGCVSSNNKDGQVSSITIPAYDTLSGSPFLFNWDCE